MATKNEKSLAPKQASEAVAQRPSTENPTAETIVEQATGAGNLTSSKLGDEMSRADAMTDDQIATLKRTALAATPQDIDSAQSIDHYNDGRYIECPCCGGEGSVELEADFLNYDGMALGVQFYGIGNEPGAAEAYFHAASPANILALLARLDRAESALAASPVEQPAAAPADERAAHVMAIPTGYALVPKRITAAMIKSAMEHHYGKRRAQQNGGAGGIVMTVNDIDWSGIDAMRRFWKGALAAAPQPPAQEKAGDLRCRQATDHQTRRRRPHAPAGGRS